MIPRHLVLIAFRKHLAWHLVRKAGRLAALLPLAILLPAGCSEDPLPGLLSQAEGAYRAGDLRAAAVYYGTAAAEAPENDFVRWQLVKLLLTLRDGAAAEKQIGAASVLGVDDDRTRPALAQALFLQGRHQEVVDLSADGLGKTPAAIVLAYQCRALIELGELESAEEVLQAATRLSRYSADVAFAEAELALHRQDLDGALAALRNTRLLEPEYPYAAARLGEIALVQDDAEEAERYFDEAVELRYGTWRDLLNRGVARLRQGKVDGARDDARRLLAAEPVRPEVQLFVERIEAGEWEAGQPQTAVAWQPRQAAAASTGRPATQSPQTRGQAPAEALEATEGTVPPTAVASTGAGLNMEQTVAEAVSGGPAPPGGPTQASAPDDSSAVSPASAEAAPLTAQDPEPVMPGHPAVSAEGRETAAAPAMFERPLAETTAERTGPPQAAAARVQDAPGGTQTAGSAPEPAEAMAAVAAAVQAWADAWSRQDVDDYLSRYAADFRPADGTSRADWAERRRDRLTRPRSIRVELSGLEVTMLDANHAQARFIQDYRASHYRDRVDKTLGLRLEGGAWKILSEISR